MIGQSTGHLNLTLVFLVPVAGLLALAFLTGQLDRWRYALLLGIVLTFQFLFSNEIFVTLTLVAAGVWLIARWQLPAWRERLGELAVHTLVAYVIAGVLLLPYLAHAFGGETSPPRRGQHTRRRGRAQLRRADLPDVDPASAQRANPRALHQQRRGARRVSRRGRAGGQPVVDRNGR